MTGFGSSQLTDDLYSVRVEIKTVNNRFLKLSTRIDEPLSAFEPRLEALIRSQLGRGSVSVTMSCRSPSSSGGARIDVACLSRYLSDAAFAAARSNWDGAIGNFLALPGVIVVGEESDEDATEHRHRLAENAVTAALEELQAMRQREGGAMQSEMQRLIDAIRERLRDVNESSAASVHAYEQRLKARVERALSAVGQNATEIDVIREVAIAADRLDVREEIVRLGSHLDQFDFLLAAEDSPGRRLEFLLQEIGREVNTIGSKANDAAVAAIVVELKAALEQIREIVQNVE